MANDLIFSVIIPCYNEEKFIVSCIQLIIQQTVVPYKLIIVNDGSTDNTVAVVKEFQKQVDFIEIVDTHKQPSFEPGAKIVQAFNVGLQHLDHWDVVFKLDADVNLPSNYFEKVIATYQENPKIGMVGGLIYVEKDGEWIYETISDKNHLRGPIKSYRRSCFEAMNGIRESIGWDTVDEILAQFYGYELKVIQDLKVKVNKPTGALYKKSHAKKMGLAMYKMNYGIIIALIAALKSSLNKKSIKDFFVIINSFNKAYFSKVPKIVNREEGKFIRNYRWKNIKAKLRN
ncbi:glycosyltransferase family 2 protein [Tenacibaculum agarivorans]|uniref:glycosyltransferase family 2 protein n=1 Tax=Tenacibaculum agarivorans TaxID=1908389 RepID=UPI0009FA91A9|nr:glycosyltransferase family 2 protein [Tenacibaculum agarivorans]